MCLVFFGRLLLFGGSHSGVNESAEFIVGQGNHNWHKSRLILYNFKLFPKVRVQIGC